VRFRPVSISKTSRGLGVTKSSGCGEFHVIKMRLTTTIHVYQQFLGSVKTEHTHIDSSDNILLLNLNSLS
jgi:hypothetical protein